MNDLAQIGSRPRGLDHVVHAVRDLDAAAEFYSRAGFQVGARNTHPWGTQNHVVQLDGFFIELLTVAAPDRLTGEGLARHFGIPNREAIARGDGFSFLLLESRDIETDVEDLERHKIGSSPALPFTREATLPDGGTTTIGFTLAFARDERSPQAGFALCRQSNPQAFWNGDYQRHPNGARGVVAAILVADNPADHHIFLSAFTGVRVLQSSSTGVVASTPRGDVEIMDPRSFKDRFGVTVAAEGEGMKLAGLRLAVRLLAQTETVLARGGVSHHRHVGRLVIPPQAALGATLVFEETP